MGKKDPRVDAYIEKAQPFAQPILRHIRKVVHAACPDVHETRTDLPNEKTLAKIIQVAAKLNDDGVPAPRSKPKPKPPLKVPPYFTAALKKNKKALAAFDAFPPSHRREYVMWVTEAKTEETRNKRLATAVEWITEGKGRNWKYERN